MLLPRKKALAARQGLLAYRLSFTFTWEDSVHRLLVGYPGLVLAAF